MQNVIIGTRVKYIITKVPIKVIPNIIGEIDYGYINEMVLNLYGNAVTNPTTLGRVRKRYAGIIMRPELCTTLSQTTCTFPIYLGATSVIPTGILKI